ncbi:MAG: hypothetical protein EOP83_06720, partial [Verrucomicrobiaceae bacterium]
MKFALLPLAISFLAIGTQANEVGKVASKADMAALVTSDMVTKHYDGGKKPAGQRKVETKDGDIYVSFSAVTIRIGAGGSFFTAEDAKKAKEGLFSAILGDGLSPRIGLRAHVYGIEDDILLFTTSDGKFDLSIEPAALTPEMKVVDLGREISNIYDKVTQPAK